MTREEHREEILRVSNHNILCELPTSFGKSKIALDILKDKAKKIKGTHKYLIVVPRVVLMKNWVEEIKKWGMESSLILFEFTTYVSLPKHAGDWDVVIFDECHHLSERCREALASFNIKHSILLSATVGFKLKDELREIFDDLYVYRVSARTAIDNEILPDPIVYLLPLELKGGLPTKYMVVNKSAKKKWPNTIPFKDYWSAKKHKEYQFLMHVTEKQFYNLMSNEIEFYKKKSYNQRMKTIWLHKCGERLKWLAETKNEIVKQILSKMSSYRTLTFCNSIEQTEELGKYCINSKNKESVNILEKFNDHTINHITACNMLNEGMNLIDCQIGIYANLNSSETIVKQRLGRILRHSNPVIIIPYYINTREEELVDKMLLDYNPQLIKTINSLNEIII